MSVALIRFPGSNCDVDCARAVALVTGGAPEVVWHEDPIPSGTRLVILPGGFSYGDYLRPGAIAHLARCMDSVRAFAASGGAVLGICNGFQILTECGLLPGALLPNAGLTFVCRDVHLRVEAAATPFLRDYREGQVLRMPVAHGDGRYHADPATLERLRCNRQIVFRYVDADGRRAADAAPSAGSDGRLLHANPNGALDDVAGICNEAGNVLGMMPHPERVCEALLGGTDGVALFTAILQPAREVLHR